jgi:hypothetical protein
MQKEEVVNKSGRGEMQLYIVFPNIYIYIYNAFTILEEVGGIEV